jgi:hypothetical protein
VNVGSTNVTATNQDTIIYHHPLEEIDAGSRKKVQAFIFDADGLKDVKLWVKGTSGDPWESITMKTDSTAGSYSANLPVQEKSGVLYYYFEVTDLRTNVVVWPPGSPPGFEVKVLPPRENGLVILNNLIDLSKDEDSAELKILVKDNGIAGEIDIEISVYSVNGRLVKRFEKQQYTPGVYSLPWHVENSIGSGLYIVRAASSRSEYRIINQKLIIRR